MRHKYRANGQTCVERHEKGVMDLLTYVELR